MVTRISEMSVASGKWGCGVFRGNLELKFLIQVLAASLVGRKIIFCDFGSKTFCDLYEKYKPLLKNEVISTGKLYSELIEIMRKLERKNIEEIEDFGILKLLNEAICPEGKNLAKF